MYVRLVLGTLSDTLNSWGGKQIIAAKKVAQNVFIHKCLYYDVGNRIGIFLSTHTHTLYEFCFVCVWPDNNINFSVKFVKVCSGEAGLPVKI